MPANTGEVFDALEISTQLGEQVLPRRDLHNAGQELLTDVTDPVRLIATLTEHEFDLLVLSTHGSGSGLDY